MDVSTLCIGCLEPPRTTPVCDRCGWDDRTEQPLPLALPHRTVLGEQYVFGRVLGHGGFGITYLAHDLNLNLKVAIKEYLPGEAATRSTDRVTVMPYTGHRETFDYGLTSFLDEARVLARFHDHPNIVTVLNFFRAHGTGYLVMSYVPGRTLKELLDTQRGVLPFRTAARVMLPVMDALRAVHGVNLLHRDISPDNIYLTTAGQVKVMDFGAARLALGERSQNLSVVLKPGYAPWEQYSSRGQQGPWTDVYAVAATLYRTITGRTPPQAPDRRDRDELIPPSQLGIEIPAAAEAALMKGLAVLVADRFRAIHELQNPLLLALNLDPVAVETDDTAKHLRPAPAVAEARKRNLPAPPIDDGRPRDRVAPVPGPPVPAPPPVRVPIPVPSPTPLDRVLAVIATVSAEIERRIALATPRLRPPSSFHPTMVLVTAIAAGLIGLFGTGWALIELLGLSPGAQIFGAFFPGLFLPAKLSLLATLAGHGALLIGAVQWIRNDVRGPTIVWAAAWVLAVLAMVGLAWFMLLTPMTETWAVLAQTTRAAILNQAIMGSLWALVQAGLVIGLVLKSGGSPAGAGGLSR